MFDSITNNYTSQYSLQKILGQPVHGIYVRAAPSTKKFDCSMMSSNAGDSEVSRFLEFMMTSSEPTAEVVRDGKVIFSRMPKGEAKRGRVFEKIWEGTSAFFAMNERLMGARKESLFYLLKLFAYQPRNLDLFGFQVTSSYGLLHKDHQFVLRWSGKQRRYGPISLFKNSALYSIHLFGIPVFDIKKSMKDDHSVWRYHVLGLRIWKSRKTFGRK